MIRAPRLLLLVAAAGLLGVVTGPLAQDSPVTEVPIRAFPEDGRATVVFEWPHPVGYEARLAGRALQITFDSPLRAGFSEVRTRLGDFVDSVGIADGGRVVTMTLAGSFRLSAGRRGNAVVLTLARTDDGDAESDRQVEVSPTPDPVAPSAPADVGERQVAASPAADVGPPSVPVRVGEHEAFSRVVFDWEQEVAYHIERRGAAAVVRFDQPARLDLSEATGKLPTDITSLDQVAAGAAAVAIGLVEGAELRDYRLGLKVVIDVFPAIPRQTAEEKEAERAAQAQAAAARAAAAATLPSLPTEPAPRYDTSPWQALAALDAPLETEPVASEPAAPEPVMSESESEPAAPEPEPVLAEAAAPDPAMAEPPAPEPAIAAPVTPEPALAEPAMPASPVLPADPEAPGVLSAEPVAPAEPPAPTEAAEAAETAEPDDPAVPAPPAETAEATGEVNVLVGFDVMPNGLDLEFDWAGDVRAAVFARAGHLWVIFDAPARFNFRLLGDDLPVIAKAEQVPLPGAAAARFVLSGRFRPTVARDGDRWRVRLGATGGAAEPLEVKIEGDSEIGARLVVATSAPGRSFALTDPEVGDQLTVVPVAGAGRGISPRRRLVDLELLETAQGVVVRAISDTVAVRSLREMVEITDLAGLEVAALSARVEAAEPRGPLTPPPVVEPPPLAELTPPTADTETTVMPEDDTPVYDFAAWRAAGQGSYLDAKHALNDRIARLDDNRRGAGRLALARFHLADGQAAEALGWIALALAEEPHLDGGAELRALRGAANFLQGRDKEARADLFDPVFDLSREMRLWRAAWLAEQGDMATANQAFIAADGVPSGYPRRVALRFRVLAGEAAARAGDVERAHALLDALREDAREPAIADRIDYIRGLAYAAEDEIELALELLAQAGASDDREVRARAERERIELMLAQDLTTPAAAIDGLEALRFAWRGDNLELDLLQRIAELQIELGQFAAGLASYRQAIAVFPDSPEVRMIANVMNDVYKGLFLGDLASRLSPLEALAIYYEFRELTPVGSVGDEMIFRLADRLVDVDLLEQAAAVLQQQVDHRLRGEQLARVGARLASIYLLDKKPKLAARAINVSAVPEPGAELARQRRDLLIRALTETSAYDEALALLHGDAGEDADRLRAEVYWRKQDWLATATVSSRMLARWQPADELTPEQLDDLMRMAVALVLTNNRGALVRLRDRYGEMLARSDRAEAFRAIASYADAGPVSPRTISDAVAEIDSYESFLASLREEVSQTSLAPAE